MRTLRICITGYGISGCTSTTRSLVEQSRHVFVGSGRGFVGTSEFLWSACGADVRVVLTRIAKLRLRPLDRIDLHRSFDDSPVEELERNALLTCEGLLIVVDAQRAAVGLSLSHVVEIRRCIERSGRSVAGIPTVFLLNKHDLPRIELPEVLASKLQWPVCDHFVTVAPAGAGVGDGLTRLIELILATRGPA